MPRLSDVPALVRAGNYPEVARGTYVPHPYTAEQAHQMVLRRRRDSRAGRALGLVIVDRATGTPVGMIGLGGLDYHDRGGELYYWLTPSLWGLGLATEAAQAVLSLAFGALALHRVTAHVHTFNHRSRRLLLRLGFRVEGRLRETRPERHRWRDSWVLGLLEEEFRSGVRRATRPAGLGGRFSAGQTRPAARRPSGRRASRFPLP